MIVATTITRHPEDVPREAFDCVRNLVDRHVVMVNGESLMPMDDDHVKWHHANPWSQNFGKARQEALDAARAHGATLVITVDTDEVVTIHREDIQRMLDVKADVGLVPHDDGSYAKERVISSGTEARWEGATHECLVGARKQIVLARSTFNEAPKTAEQLRAKFTRDRDILLGEVQARPAHARSHYYLAESLRGLGDTEGAFQHYTAAARLESWPEGAAWAHFRAGVEACALKRLQAAQRHFLDGLACDARVAECAWMAGWVAYQMGDYNSAVSWSYAALAMADTEVEPRIGFRDTGLRRGCLDTVAWSFRKLGRHELADKVQSLRL